MSLTKKDKEEIVDIIKHTLTTMKSGELAVEEGNKAQEIQMQIDKWDAKAISTGLGFVIAPENYYEGDKQHFTWDEAMDIQENIKASGWRLPTVGEWVQMYGKYGIDENGKDDPYNLMESLSLPLAGYYYNGSCNYGGSGGNFWSSTAYDTTYAYNLYFNSTYVGPQSSNDKSANGFDVRMIKEVKNESNR